MWNLTNFRVFLAILRLNLSIFAKFNSKMGSFVLFSTKFNSNLYSFFCFSTNSIQKFIQFSFFNKIQFKSSFNSLVSDNIQFKNIFKILKLAVFNSIKYSFNKKTWVSDMASLRSHLFICISHGALRSYFFWLISIIFAAEFNAFQG